MEDTGKPVPPETEDLSRAKIMYLISRVHRHVLWRTVRATAAHGLTPAQFTALTVLKTFGPLSNAELSRRSFVAPQSMHELLNTLESEQLTFRQRIPGNGRAVQIGLTDAGRKLVIRCERRTGAIEKAMLKGLNAQARIALQSALSQCVRSLEQPSIAFVKVPTAK